MKKLGLGALAALLATPAFASTSVFSNAPTVPEIDAMAGFAAIAVVGAAVALIRERSK